MGRMAKAIINAKAFEDIEHAEDAKANCGDIGKCNTMIEKANQILSKYLSSICKDISEEQMNLCKGILRAAYHQTALCTPTHPATWTRMALRHMHKTL